MSIRLRLALLYSAILALTLIAFSTLLYIAQSRSTLNALQRELADNAFRLARAVETMRRFVNDEDGMRNRDPARPAGPMADPPADGVGPFIPRSRDSVRILDAQGEPFEVGVNENSPSLPLSPLGTSALQTGEARAEIVHLDGERWLIHNQPVQRGGQVIGMVQVASSLAERDRSLKALSVSLIAGSLLTTALAFGAGWMLSGAALQPIHRITQTAQQIGRERDLTARVEHRGPEDELGRLATTFNAMLSRLEKAYERIARALQMQRDFVADVSHELRTPLTTLRGNLALLAHKAQIPESEREDILNDMVDETERLIRLVNDLLVLARADAGRTLNREPVRLSPLIDEVVRQAQALEPQRDIQCPGASSAAVLADRDALKQVLLILLDNALKHTEGPIKVSVSERDSQISIGIHDSGPGMPADLRERMFDRFYRGDGSRTSPGFGLGLPIAKALTESQLGTIEIESAIDQGSTFCVILPRADPTSASMG